MSDKKTDGDLRGRENKILFSTSQQHQRWLSLLRT